MNNPAKLVEYIFDLEKIEQKPTRASSFCLSDCNIVT